MNYINVLRCFPINLRSRIEFEIKENNMEEDLEEIRIRLNLPVIIKSSIKEAVSCYIVTSEDINETLQKVCENSIYAYQKQISSGYVTISGGNRVGIVGSGVFKDDKIINLNYISGLNFRISRQVLGCSNSVIEDIINRKTNNIYNTLIISAPGMGKTTLLKDIVKKISDGLVDFKRINNKRN